MAAESETVERKMIAPDGGWGWVVAIAYALNNVTMVPIMQSFGLVLKDVFKELDIPATDATVIISVNSAFGMAVGLIHGPLLRNFGYRKIAFLGSTIFALGITFTAFAMTFTHFMVTYGLMASLGVGLTMSSFSLAVNTYFVQKRGRAVGMAMTVTGLGPILMPQLISYLLSFYGNQGTILILGGLTLHSLVATMLLQPVKWHATRQPKESKNDLSYPMNEVEGNVTKAVEEVVNNVPLKNEECPRKRESSSKMVNSVSDDTDSERKSLRAADAVSTEEVTLLVENKRLEKEIQETPAIVERVIPEKSSYSRWQSTINYWKIASRKIACFFDFDLLRDPIYVNMMFGMSIALFAEINFAVLTPFILGDMQFDTEKIATVMSTLAGVDLVSRGSVPFLGEWLRLSARHMALFSLFLLICCRTMLIFSSDFATVLFIAVVLGFAKGIRSVNMSLVIPNYIPIERLASATGIQMVVNGLVLMTLGPLLGLSRDKFGSYVPSLIIINTTTAITIVMWLTEMCIVGRNTKRKHREHRYDRVEARE